MINEGLKKVNPIEQSLRIKRAIMDDNMFSWKQITEKIKEEYKHIVALRGAGSVNGIDRQEVDSLIQSQFIPRLEAMMADGGKVAILFDGDSDDLENPDIGYVMGRLREHFDKNPNTLFVTAQQKSWYYPVIEGGNLSNAQGLDYVTYVFEDDKYEGNHNSFTQGKELVDSEGYEQWYIGASGNIANEQLEDFNKKIVEGKSRKAVIFRAPNNAGLDEKFRGDIEKAGEDEIKKGKIQKKLDQRKDNTYGTHWNQQGNPTLESSKYPKLKLEFVS